MPEREPGARSRRVRSPLQGARARAAPALAAALLVAGFIAARAQEGRFTDFTTVLAVEVPVQVTRDGEPVRGLTAADFEVFEGRKRLQIVDFDVVDLKLLESYSEGPGGTPLPSRSRRHFLMLFDLSFSAPASVVRAQRAARELVLDGFHPSDLVAVATYAGSRGAELVLGFTPDRPQILAALDTLGIVEPLHAVSDPLRLLIAETEESYRSAVPQPTGGPAGGARGGDFDRQATLLAHLRDLAPMAARANREVMIDQILDMTGSLSELAEHLNSVEGRKQVVFFSEGFDSSVLLGTDDPDQVRRLAEASAAGEVWQVDSDERFGSGATQSGILAMLQEFRRCDCTVHTVDIGGLRAGSDVSQSRTAAGRPRASGEEGLFLMADQTGGEFYRNYNNLTDAMSELLERTSLTYVLVLEPRLVSPDGTYHPIRVKLKKGTKRARVRHRPGYFAPRPYASQAELARRLSTGDLIAGGVEGGDLSTSVLAVPFRGSGERAYVMVMVEIVGHTLLAGRSRELLPIEIYAYALDEAGSVRDFFSQAVVLDLARVEARLMANGFKFLGHLTLPPGEYALRVLTRQGISGSSGLRVTRLEVPEAGEASLLPPLFIEPEGAWLLGWEDREAGGESSYPLVLREQKLIPATKPILPAGREAPVLLVASGLGSGQLAAEARFETLEGSESWPARVAIRDRFPTEVPGVERLWASVAPESVAPGEYRLVVTLSDPEGGRRVESSLPVYLQ